MIGLPVLGIAVALAVTYGASAFMQVRSDIRDAGASEEREKFHVAIATENAAVASRANVRADAAERREAERKVAYEANEAVYRGRIAALRSLPPEQEGFQCPEPDEWRLLRHCPYYSP